MTEQIQQIIVEIHLKSIYVICKSSIDYRRQHRKCKNCLHCDNQLGCLLYIKLRISSFTTNISLEFNHDILGKPSVHIISSIYNNSSSSDVIKCKFV